MAKHVHIHFSPRKAVRDQAPGSVPPSNLMPLVEALHEAIAARQPAAPAPTKDADFDESKIKRDEGGRFSAQQHEAAAAEHKAEAEKHDAAYKATNDPQHALARNAHQEAGVHHGVAAKHVQAQTGWSDHNAQQAHNATALAKQMSAKTAGSGNVDQLKATASDPKASIEQRAAAVSQLSKMEKMANEVAGSPHAVPQMSAQGQEMGPSMQAALKQDIYPHAAPTEPVSMKPDEGFGKEHAIPKPKMRPAGLPPEPGHGQPSSRQAAAALEASKPGPDGKPMGTHPALAAVTAPGTAVPGSAQSPQGNINQVTGKPTSAKASGAKAATHELLSSGHPFSVDELMKATGCANKATLLTALSDLKSPKYAGKLGHLAIEKNADGMYQVKGLGPVASPAELAQAKSRNQYAEASKTNPRPAPTPLNGKTPTEVKNNLQASAGTSASGNLPMRNTPKGGDVNPVQNVQARMDAKAAASNAPKKSIWGTSKPALKPKDLAVRSGQNTDPKMAVKSSAGPSAPGASQLRAQASEYASTLSNRANASNSEVDHRAAAEAHQKAGDMHDKKGNVENAAKHYKMQGHHERQAEQMRPFGQKSDDARSDNYDEQEEAYYQAGKKHDADMEAHRDRFNQPSPAPAMNVDPISHKTSMPGASTTQGAVVSGRSAPTPELVNELRFSAGSWRGGSPITTAQVEAAAKYMHGKAGVDILKMAEATGLSVGAAKHLNEARKAHYATQGGTRAQTSAERSDAFLKQRWIKK